jgi:hypothetical protein
MEPACLGVSQPLLGVLVEGWEEVVDEIIDLQSYHVWLSVVSY